MGDISKHRAGVENDLLRAICQFNFLPVRYIHTSWLTSLPGGAVLEKLRHCKRTEHPLSRYLLRQLGLEGQYWFDFNSDPLSRIALLDSANLARVILYAGLALNAKPIRHVIARQAVLSLKRNLGEDAYQFALERAPLLDAAPDLSGDQYRYSRHLPTQAIISGVKCLATALSDCQPAMTQRLLIKLPITWKYSYSRLSSKSVKKEDITLLIRSIMNTEADPI